MAYSTIIKKKKECIRCGKLCYWFSHKRCVDCARIESTMARMEEEADYSLAKEGLSDLIKEADAIYSKWLRKSQADNFGIVSCYTCDKRMRWEDSQCGHYIKRGNLFLRFDPRNTKIQGECCNIFLHGNYAEFTKRLEFEHPGLPEYLTEEALLVHKPTRDEIKSIILDYTHKLKMLLTK